MKSIEFPFADLIGLTFTEINVQDEQILFATDTRKFCMHHYQDCCEDVHVESVTGDIIDLIGSPILKAEESTNENDRDGANTITWTFYKLATIKGYVDIRWKGESNGYYSESVNFEELFE